MESGDSEEMHGAGEAELVEKSLGSTIGDSKADPGDGRRDIGGPLQSRGENPPHPVPATDGRCQKRISFSQTENLPRKRGINGQNGEDPLSFEPTAVIHRTGITSRWRPSGSAGKLNLIPTGGTRPLPANLDHDRDFHTKSRIIRAGYLQDLEWKHRGSRRKNLGLSAHDTQHGILTGDGIQSLRKSARRGIAPAPPVQKREDPHGHGPANPSAADRHQHTPHPHDDACQQKVISPAGLGQQNPGNRREENPRKRETLKEG